MNVKFTGAYYFRTESPNFKIKILNGIKEWVLLHFYSPMVVLLNGKRFETQSNACILYKPSTPIFYWAKTDKFQNDYIKFFLDDISFFDQFKIPINEIFYVKDFNVIRDEMRDITFYMTERLENYDKELFNCLCSALKKLQENRVYLDKKVLKDNDRKLLLFQFRQKIEEHPENWTVDSMAESLCLTRSYFSTLYKKIFGASPQVDLKIFLNNKAIHLLSTTTLSIQNIAASLNYNESENFIRAFRKINGISPLQFRKKYQKISYAKLLRVSQFLDHKLVSSPT